jgi:Mrp family chromosome partitioning ATPase
MDAPAPPGLVDVLDGHSGIAEAVTEKDGVAVLPAGRLAGRDPAVVFEPDRMLSFVEEVSRQAGVVVIDAGSPAESPEAQVLCAAVDRVIVVALTGETRGRDLELTHRLLAEVDASVVGVVLDADHRARADVITEPTDSAPARRATDETDAVGQTVASSGPAVLDPPVPGQPDHAVLDTGSELSMAATKGRNGQTTWTGSGPPREARDPSAGAGD